MAAPQEVYRQVLKLGAGELSVRRMTITDLAAVLHNERSAYSHPWTEGIFRDCLSSSYENWVLEQASNVSGHAVLSVSLEEAHILNLCVAPHCQRRGVGRLLLDFLVHRCRERGVENLFLEVRQSNEPAILLYETTGFREVGRRKDYYPATRGREDALVMMLPILCADFDVSL